jgi:chromosome segregation ATPase
MMPWSQLLDVVVAGLLVATIAYAVRLSRRLAVLREDRQQLQDMIKGLQKATQQAEEAVGGLRLGAADAGKGLHDIVERAQGLKADLLFITEKADSAADRLEVVLKTQRETASPAETPPAAREPRRRANPDLDAAAADAKGAQSRLASLLKQADNTPTPRPAPRPASPAEAERATLQSRAERDLQRALDGRR